MEKQTCSRRLVVSLPLLPVEASTNSPVPRGVDPGRVTYQSPAPPP